jgi:hypothetical protein
MRFILLTTTLLLLSLFFLLSFMSSMVFEEIFAFHMGIGNNLTYFMVILNVQWFQSISITYQVSPVFFKVIYTDLFFL